MTLRVTAETDAAAGAPAGHGVLVIGEALVDVVSRDGGQVDAAPGGSAANVALTLGRLGHTPRLLTALGDDPHGRAVLAWLAQSGVEVTAVAVPRTATATARLDAAGSATYEFDLAWDLPTVPPVAAGIVHTGSIAALLPPGDAAVRSVVEELREAALVTFDPNVRPALLGEASVARPRIEEFVALADLVKASDEDLAWLYPGRDPLDVARAWQRTGPAVVVVTTGAGGAVAVTATEVVRVAAEKVTVIDTVGAGDTFMGALIDGLLRDGYDAAPARARLRRIGGGELAEILRFSARAAAVTVSRPGADPPTRAELAGSVVG